MKLASSGPCTLSFDTTRKNVGYLPVVSAAAVADPEMNASPARAIRGPTASTSWLPAGPTTATIFVFEVNCWVTVVAIDGVSCVSPWTIEIWVWLAALSIDTASSAKWSCSCPSDATGPVSGPSMPVEATHAVVAALLVLVLALLLLLLLELLQPATTSAPTAATAMITLFLIGYAPPNIRDLFHCLGDPVSPGRSATHREAQLAGGRIIAVRYAQRADGTAPPEPGSGKPAARLASSVISVPVRARATVQSLARPARSWN